MESPCINICVLDQDRGLCRGCYRSLDEIARWGMFSAAERTRIMETLEARRVAQDSARQTT